MDDFRGMATLPNGLAIMVGARADTEVIKARRKATVFMVLKVVEICGGGAGARAGSVLEARRRARGVRVRESVWRQCGVVRVCGAGG